MNNYRYISEGRVSRIQADGFSVKDGMLYFWMIDEHKDSRRTIAAVNIWSQVVEVESEGDGD